MRAVNLVPKDYRRGPLAGKGGEALSYVLIAGLAVLLIGVLAVVLTNNSVSDKKAELAKLEQERVDAKAKADALQSYANFASLQQSRTSTISSLAQSRFDWERVMQELGEVVPSDVSLVKLSGTVLPGVPLGGGASLTIRDSVTGPALEIIGCAPDQEQVATFVAALEDIDGVTRVGVQSSTKSEQALTAGGGSSEECRVGDDWAKFELLVAFDAAPVPAGADAAGAPAAAPTTPAPTTPPPGGDGGVGQGQQQQAGQQQGVQDAKAKSEKATNFVPGN